MKAYTLTMLLLYSTAAAAGSYSKTVPVSGKAEVTVNVRSGELKISGWDKPQVLIESDDDVGEHIRVNGSQVRIGPESKGPEGIDDDIEIKLPADAQLNITDISGDVTVSGMNGRLKLNVISGDATLNSCKGPVTVKAVSGDVEITGVSEGLTVKGVSGNLKVTGLQGGLVEAKTVSGEITLRKVQANQVRLKSVSGNIVLQGQFPADGQVKASTLSGDVTIILPKGATFDLEAKSRSGSVSSDFDLQVFEKRAGKMQGKAGSGGTAIDLGSFSGNLRVRSENH